MPDPHYLVPDTKPYDHRGMERLAAAVDKAHADMAWQSAHRLIQRALVHMRAGGTWETIDLPRHLRNACRST